MLHRFQALRSRNIAGLCPRYESCRPVHASGNLPGIRDREINRLDIYNMTSHLSFGKQGAIAMARRTLLQQRPKGMPPPDDFELVEPPVPTPGPGEVLVRNRFLSLDPY